MLPSVASVVLLFIVREYGFETCRLWKSWHRPSVANYSCYPPHTHIFWHYHPPPPPPCAMQGENCQGACPKSAHNGQLDALTANNGQSCYWFSNGCMVGCDECDGTNNHVGHGAQSFLYVILPSLELVGFILVCAYVGACVSGTQIKPTNRVRPTDVSL